MLILTRKRGESIRLELPDGREVLVMVCRVQGDAVRLGIEAPLDVGIARTELAHVESPLARFLSRKHKQGRRLLTKEAAAVA
jgi:carbon storage regulator CsrA